MSNPWELAQLLLDANKRPIPQLWDDVNQKFVPYTPTVAGGSNSGGNSGGSSSTVTTNTYVAKEPFSGSANVTHTFNESMNGFVISNDGASDLTFTIGTDTYTVKAGEVFEDLFNSFTTVTINTTVAFRAYGKMSVTPVVTVTTPADVTNLATSNVTQTTLTLSWTASSGATSYDVYNGSTLLTNVTTTSYNVTGLTASTQYTFKVVAKNSAGSSAGVTTTVTTSAPAVTIPNDVTNLAVGTISSSTVALSWTASSGATSYDVYQGSTLLGNTTSTSYTASGLSASTAYTFKVVAKNSAGSSIGVTVNATTSAPPQTAPNDVTNLATSSVTYNSLTVSWTASSGATSYDVYQGATLLGNTASTSYNVTGLSASTSYTFKVIAKNSAGSSTGVTTTATTAVAPPSDVTNLAASSITQTSLTLGWTASANATSYDVYNGATLLGNVTATSYNVTGLTAGTQYTFKVIAKNGSGSSTGVTVTTTTTVAAPSTPTGLTATAGNNQVSLSWTAVSGATSYNVYRGGTKITSPTTNSYTDTTAVNGTAYSYTVSAVNAGGESAQSSAQSATPTAPTVNPVSGLAVTTASITPSSIPITWSTYSGTGTNLEVSYSTDGTNFTVASSTVSPSAGSYIVNGLNQTTAYTIRVVALDASNNRSTAVMTTGTTLTLTASASPVAGTYSSTQSVTLSSNGVSGTKIYYTTDGSTPTTSSTVYSSAITVSATETIKFFGVDPSGNQSAVQSATYTINALTTVVYDSFTDTNGTDLTVHTPDTSPGGVKWKNNTLNSAWAITGNQAYNSTTNIDVAITIDSGKSDGTVQVAIPTMATNSRLVFRYVDDNNLFIVQATSNYTLFSKVSGSYTSLGSGGTALSGDVVKAVLSGSSITIYVNNVSIISVTNTNFTTATKHGIGGGGSGTGAARFDEFKVLA